MRRRSCDIRLFTAACILIFSFTACGGVGSNGAEEETQLPPLPSAEPSPGATARKEENGNNGCRETQPPPTGSTESRGALGNSPNASDCGTSFATLTEDQMRSATPMPMPLQPMPESPKTPQPYPEAMERVLMDQILQTDYGQFDLVWAQDGGFDGNFDRFFSGQVNGLVGASDPHGVYINLARRSGGSPVRIVLIDAPPTGVDAFWEDVVDVSFTLPEGHDVRWTSWAGESAGILDGLPPGSYRLRVSAKGRDQGHAGEFSEHPVDAYLLQMWQAPPQPDAVLRTGSQDGRYWHREVGQRR